MKIRKRIAALVVAVLSVTGLALIGSVAQSGSAAASPALGSHTVASNCTDGTFTGQFLYNYTITFKSYDAHNRMTTYRFQLNSSLYKGNAGAGGRPSAWVTPANGIAASGWVNATHGGAASTANADVVWPLGTAIAPTSSRVNGLAGVSWTGVDIQMGGLAANEDFMRITWPSHVSCEVNINLALPDAPIEEIDFLDDTCGVGPTDPTYFRAQLDYEITHVSGQQYQVKVDQLITDTVRGSGGTGTQPYDQLSIYIQGALKVDGTTTSAKDASLNNTNVNTFPRPFILIPDTATHYDWTPQTPPFDQFWKPVTFEWAGNNGMKPQIIVEAHMFDNSGSCILGRSMTEDFSAPGQTYGNVQTYPFSDCKGGTGQLVLTSNWTWDANSELVRLNSISITNNSVTKITFPAPSLGADPNPLFRADATAPYNYYAGMTGASSATYRIWAAGQTKTLDITDPVKWDLLAGATGNSVSVPGSPNRWYVSQIPVMQISAIAENLNGVIWSECIAARQGLTLMEASSARI